MRREVQVTEEIILVKIKKTLSLAKMGIFKTIIRRLFQKLPFEIEAPRMEELQYLESRWLYQLMTVLDYCYHVEDKFAKALVKHDPSKHMDYRAMMKMFLAFMINLCEADSYYRHRVLYALWFMRAPIFLNEYYRLIKEKGFDVNWDGTTVIDMKVHTIGNPKAQKGIDPKQSMSSKGVFSHLSYIPRTKLQKTTRKKM